MPSKLFKPFPSQALPPLTELAQKRNAANAIKRQQRHEAKEAAKAPEDRLMNRTDLDVRARKIYTMEWLKKLRSIMLLFAEFTVQKLDMQPDDEGHGSQYFKPGHPLPSRIMIRRFLYWLAESASGNIATASFRPSETTQNNNIALASIKVYATRLFSALAYYNEHPDAEIVKDTKRWLDSQLAKDLDLDRERRTKPTVYQ